MTPWLPVAAFFLVQLVRTAIPAAWRAVKPWGCNVCMASWATLILGVLVYPPLSWQGARWLPLWWMGGSAPAWLALEAWEWWAPRPPPPASLLPPDDPPGPYI